MQMIPNSQAKENSYPCLVGRDWLGPLKLLSTTWLPDKDQKKKKRMNLLSFESRDSILYKIFNYQKESLKSNITLRHFDTCPSPEDTGTCGR